MASTKTITVTNETVTIPAMTDRPDASQFSDGVSKLVDGINSNTQAIAKEQEAIAIVCDGNTHANIAAGQYVYIKNHSTLAEGLYTATAAIGANNNPSGSVQAVSGGGLNSLNSKITVTTITATKTANIKNNSVVVAKKSGNIVSIYMDVYAASTLSDYVTIANLSETIPTNTYFVMVDSNDGTKMCRLTTSGELQIHGTVADKNYMGNLSCIVTS